MVDIGGTHACFRGPDLDVNTDEQKGDNGMSHGRDGRTAASKGTLAGARSVTGLVLALSFAAGVGDSFAFLTLGGIFTANMTGNVVLATMFSRPDYLATVAAALCALTAFAGAAFITFHVLGRGNGDRPRGAKVPAVLGAAAVVQTGMATVWTLAAGRAARIVAVALAAAVMGIQSAVMKRAAVAGGVTTTYITGTITGIADDLATGREPVGTRVVSLLTFVAGGVTGCALTMTCERLAPWVSLAVLLLATRCSMPRRRSGPAESAVSAAKQGA